jgi:adenylate cyclase
VREPSVASNREYERRFLVTDEAFISDLGEGTPIVQGYLEGAYNISVRVRFLPRVGVYQLTLKSRRSGVARVEVEQELSAEVGQLMLDAASDRLVEKRRVPILGPDGRGWDVDVFHGANSGLVIAEVELEAPDVEIVVPDWCDLEVTDEDRYYNEQLARHPTSVW